MRTRSSRSFQTLWAEGTTPPQTTSKSSSEAPLLEEVPMGMVEGPMSKEMAAERCDCSPGDLCPGPLASIDEKDKVRTIYDGSVGGGPMTLSGTRRWSAQRPPQCWMESKLSISFTRQQKRGPHPMPPSLSHGGGSGRSLAPGGCYSRRTSPRPTGE